MAFSSFWAETRHGWETEEKEVSWEIDKLPDEASWLIVLENSCHSCTDV